MDELLRAIEATLFASAEPLTVDELQEHVGEGDIEVALGQLALHYEGRGIGKRLLGHAVDWLRSRGWRRLWLATNPDPNVRSHGFYRSQGWRPTGERQERAGDEILVRE